MATTLPTKAVALLVGSLLALVVVVRADCCHDEPPPAEVQWREQLQAVRGEVGELQESGKALVDRLEAADDRTDRLERQVAELQQELRSASRARRRTQRTGGAEAAQIIKIQTTATACPAAVGGRIGLTECQEPDFERCHRVACAPILQGHRRMQAAEPQPCPEQSLPARTCSQSQPRPSLCFWRAHMQVIQRSLLSDDRHVGGQPRVLPRRRVQPGPPEYVQRRLRDSLPAVVARLRGLAR
jgi:hypothetical protein